MKIFSKLSSLSKVITFSMVSTLPLSASAVIIEGSFEGRMWEYQNTNMEGTADAGFFTDDNAFSGFTGTFWYDTDLAGSAVNDTDIDGSVSATYSGPHDWLHTTVTGHDGGTLALTSSGGTETISAKPYEEISVGYYVDYYDGTQHDRLSVSYDDNFYYHVRDPNLDAQTYRAGSFSLEPAATFLNGLDLIQNASADTNSYGGNVVGYLSFETKGKLNGVDYFGWMVGEINQFEIHVQTPEPSSLLLFLGPLLLILSRAGLIANPFSHKT